MLILIVNPTSRFNNMKAKKYLYGGNKIVSIYSQYFKNVLSFYSSMERILTVATFTD